MARKGAGGAARGTVLDGIVGSHRRAAAADRRSLGDLMAAAASLASPVRPFRAALATPGVAVVAEVKRRSPSAGPLAPDLVPSDLAACYEEAGAAALSVLTDAEFFGGSGDDLEAARAACSLPVLRKDFTVSEADVCDARLMGADAVLLIVAALFDDEVRRFRSLAMELGMDVMVEVHDESELELALRAGADLVGVNRRDLRTFEIDRGLAARLAWSIPAGVVKVAESGVRSPADVAELSGSGYDAVLVGETLVRAADPGDALRDLTSASS